MKILLTGPNSFSGKIILDFLQKQNYDITVISRSKLSAAIASKIKSIYTDLANLPTFNEHFDAVIHIAATSPDVNINNNQLIQDNVIATQNLMNALANCALKRFIFFSSCSVYGEIKTSVLTENTPTLNPCVYGASKLMCESLLYSQKNFPVISLRLPAILGKNASRHWLANLIKKILMNEEITLYHPDALFNNAIHVEELAKFVHQLLLFDLFKSCDYLNVASKGGLSVYSIAEKMIKHFNSHSKIKIAKPHKNHFIISNTYAESHYQFKPINFETTLERYLSI